jgi:hypothetical protein
MDKHINEHEDADWWTGQGEPYLDNSDTFSDATYAGFLVMSSEQRDACDSVDCMGWK